MNLKNDTGTVEKKSLGKSLKLVFSYGFGELVEDIVKWLLIGLLAAALLSVVIPDSFFTSFIGNSWLEMTMILAASIPLYVCATGSIPIAAVFLLKGLSPGAALVFLMAGTATNVATMTVIGKTMGRKALIIYLFSIIAGAMIFGVIVNEFLPASWFTNFSIMDHEHGFLPDWMKLVSTVLLSGMVLMAVYTKWLSPKFKKSGNSNNKNSDMSDSLYTNIIIEGMTCNHCKSTVEKNIEGLDGVESVEVDLSDGSVQIKGDADLFKVEQLVNSLGYRYKG
jgi:copper chaperone CopZ